MQIREIQAAIETAWDTRSIKMNWLGLEDVMVSILKCEMMTDATKCDLMKQAIDAFTKRGHF